MNESSNNGKTTRRGRPFIDFRATLDGLWWILRTGSMWNQLPPRFGKWNSVYRCHLRWAKEGLWNKVFALVKEFPIPDRVVSIDATHIKAHQDACRYKGNPQDQGLGKTKGGRNSKLNVMVDEDGEALAILLLPGNEHEVLSAPQLLGDDLRGIIVLADKGYQSRSLAEHILEAGGIPNIPSRDGTKEPLPYDKDLGKLRHVVENFFSRLKRSRRVGTRYDRLAKTFMAFVTLAALADCLNK